MFSPVVVLVIVLDSQEGVCEDVYEGHSDGRTQPAVKLVLSAFSTLLNIVDFPPSNMNGCVWLEVKETVFQSNLR